MKLCVSYRNSLKLCVSLSLSFSTSLFNIKTWIVLDRSTHGDQSYLDPSINLFKFFNYSFIVTLNYWNGNKKTCFTIAGNSSSTQHTSSLYSFCWFWFNQLFNFQILLCRSFPSPFRKQSLNKTEILETRSLL